MSGISNAEVIRRAFYDMPGRGTTVESMTASEAAEICRALGISRGEPNAKLRESIEIAERATAESTPRDIHDGSQHVEWIRTGRTS